MALWVAAEAATLSRLQKIAGMVLREILGVLRERIFCQSRIASVGKHGEAKVWSLTTAYRKITANCNQDPFMFPSTAGHHTMKQWGSPLFTAGAQG